MHSLRTRLALLSSLVSGVVIVALCIFVWGYVRETLYRSVDLRLTVPVDRMIDDMHPRGLDALVERLQPDTDEERGADSPKILLFDEQESREVLRLPEGEWLAQVDESFWKTPGEDIQNRGPRPDIPPPEQLHRGPRPSVDGPSNDEEAEFLREFFGEGKGGPQKGDGKGLPGKGKGDRKGEGGVVLAHENRPSPEVFYETVLIDGAPWRFAMTRDRGYLAMIGYNLSETANELNHIKRGFFIGVPLALLFIGSGGWFIANRALRPVKTITDTASKVTASGLDERIPESPHVDSELSELTAVLNGMMDRLEKSFTHANRFSADVSHELKTPLAIMQGELESALKTCDPGSEEETNLLNVRREVQRLKSITGSLMILAQADSGILPTRRQTVDLSEEIEALCEDAEILCEQNQLTLTCEVQREVTLETDSGLLRQALQNLISNAVKYNEPDGKVSVLLEENESEIVIVVANTGPGIPENEREKIFDRFHRADKARSRNVDGFGLGLNLAMEIIRGLGGDLSLARATAEMTKFEVRFRI